MSAKVNLVAGPHTKLIALDPNADVSFTVGPGQTQEIGGVTNITIVAEHDKHAIEELE